MDYCFSPPTFLSTGDKWRQPPHLPAKWRDKSRNFVTCSSKKGKTAANFGDGPCDYRGAYGGEPYVEYDKMMGKVRKASKSKFRTPEGFRYASQRPETFGKGIEYKPEGGYDPVKRRDTIAPRNVGTAKGRSRNETITGAPMVTYSTDPYEATDVQLKKEQDHHKELCAKIGSARPYSSATCANRAFGTVENEPETDKPLYAKDHTRPWTRSGPFRRAVKGGEMFCPVPDLLPEPYDDVARRRAALPLRRQPVAIKTRHLPPSLKERPPFRSTHAKPKAGPTRVLSIAGAKGRV